MRTDKKILWAAVYVGFVLMANYTAVWFIPFPAFGMIALGTLFFGVTFTARDYVHELGRKKVYSMILIAMLSSSVLSMLGNVPWRIVMASVIAIALSEVADTEVYQKLIGQNWFIRVIGSNAISIPLDTILFNLLAFGGVFAPSLVVSIIVGEIVVKFTVGTLVALWRLILI